MTARSSFCAVRATVRFCVIDDSMQGGKEGGQGWSSPKRRKEPVAWLWSSPVPLLLFVASAASALRRQCLAPYRYSRASLLAKTFLVFWVFFLFWFFFSLSLLPPGPPPSLFFLYIIHDQSLQGHMLGAPTALRRRRRATTASSSRHCLSLFSLFL